MWYPAAEKLEIIRLVEQSHLPVRRTLAKIGIPPTTFYRWYDRFVEHGPEGLEDRPSRPSRVWNRIPEAVRDQIVTLALEEPELSPRELAVKFTDTKSILAMVTRTSGVLMARYQKLRSIVCSIPTT
jgi:putative transposase